MFVKKKKTKQTGCNLRERQSTKQRKQNPHSLAIWLQIQKEHQELHRNSIYI